MKCIECGGKMRIERGPHNYEPVKGFVIKLEDIEIRRCEECDDEEYVIPAIEAVDARAARSILNKSGPLAGVEVRFLRKHLGLSSSDFARYLGVAPETVSRWENDKQDLGAAYDRAIRLFVANMKPITDYSAEGLKELDSTAKPKPVVLKLKHKKGSTEWSEARA